MILLFVSQYALCVINLKKYILTIYYSEENDVVPKVVESILNLPTNTHIAVRHTSLLLLGQLSEWIEKHPQYLGN